MLFDTRKREKHPCLFSRNVVDVVKVKAVEALLETAVNALCHPLEGKLVVELLHVLGNTRLDALSDSLCGRGKVGDVAFPSRSPFLCL